MTKPVPWADVPQRWGHPWHSMCSYLGAFPAGLARSLLALLSDENDVVLDPFSGRGTTLLEARLMGRMPLASDLNPIALALTRAKNAAVLLDDILVRIGQLERKYDPLLYVPEAQVQPDDILLIFHPRTLAQLCYLRRRLLNSSTAVDEFLTGAVLGVMHGSERQDGSSSYASISMPNTFSMSPDYVRRFVETKRLQRVDRNVFQMLRDKTIRLFREGTDFLIQGIVARSDAKYLASTPEFQPYVGQVDLVLTSPPYLGIVNYAKQNWIRNWFLRADAEIVSDTLDDNLSLSAWIDFAEQSTLEIKRMLRPQGVAVFVIGDVARSSNSVISLAREFLRRLMHQKTFRYIGCLNDRLQETEKTTKIWKDTKGQATAVDRIVILSDAVPNFRNDRLQANLFGLQSDLFSGSEASISSLDVNELERYAYSFAG